MIELFIVLQQIEDVLQHIIEFYHDNFGVSWGWSIVLLTVTVRIAILPLTIKQFRSMAAMQRIQPKVKALQNKYKGKSDPDAKKQQQAELMALYKEHNVNPFASCLPMVFQMPVFIGLYQTLRNFHPGSDVAFLGITDIFVPLNQIGGATEVIMVLAYSLSMLGSTLLFSFVQDRQQKLLFASMSVIFIPFILRVPAGVGIYWITTNLWTIGQQALIKNTMGHHFPHLQTSPKVTTKSSATGSKGKGGEAQKKGSRNPPKNNGSQKSGSGRKRGGKQQ